jgi:CheY-like chemotaxis protein
MMRLVLADDVPAVREVIRGMLVHAPGPCEVVGEAGTGPEALAQLIALAPDAAILDVNMPGMSGVEVVWALRLRGDRTPVILCSGEALPASLPPGVVCQLRKPIRLEHLLEAVTTAVRQ